MLIVAALALAGWQASRAFRRAAEPAPASATVAVAPSTITALGRLEPRDGAIRIAGPSRASVVVEGSWSTRTTS